MAYINMTKANVDVGLENKFAYEAEVSLAAVANSAWILIPRDIRNISVTLSVSGGGKGKVQHTTDPIETVKNGSPIAIDWDIGEVAVNTSDVAFPVTAIRLSQTFAGNIKLTVRAQ